MSAGKFNTEEYFLGQADACEMFAKQFKRYEKAAKNPEAAEFCAKTVEWLLSTRKNFLEEAQRLKVNDDS